MSNTPNPNVFFRSEDMGIGNFPIKGGKISNQPINDGGPAFPSEEQIRCNGEVCDTRKFPGMTLRDYFAAAALQGMIASCTQQNWQEEYAAKASYQLADAMLKAREGK